MYKRIIAAVDGSENGNRAAVRAGEIAKGSGAELLLINVEPREPVPDNLKQFARAEHLDQGPQEVWENIGREVLHRAKEAIEDRIGKDLKIATRTAIGDPAHAILDAVDSEGADAVVVGTRGHGRLEGLVLGSVSQKLASSAPVDVLIVK